MKIFPLTLACTLALASATSFAKDQSLIGVPQGGAGKADAQVSACFVPAETCVTKVVAAIASAKTSIRLQAYGFTSVPILKALLDAKKAGVDVAIILDKTNLSPRYTGANTMLNATIPVWIDSKVAIAHNKVIIIDNHLVVGGSYNYTMSAEQKNAENVTFIDSPIIAGWYLQNWESRKNVSKSYTAA